MMIEDTSHNSTDVEAPGPVSFSRRDVLIAVAALGGILGAVVCFVAIQFSKDTLETVPVVSSAAWLGVDAGSSEASLAVDNLVTDGYAPTPSDLAIDVAYGSTDSDDRLAGDENIKTGTVQSGVPVITALTRLGLSMQDAHDIITSLDGVFDFRRSRPGDSFEVHLEPKTGKPSYFLYQVSKTQIFEVFRRGGELKGRQKKVDTQKKFRKFGGTISSSLYKALSELGAHPSLSSRMVGVLSSQVNFYKAQRPGDTFRVVLEEESLDGEFLSYGAVEALEYSGKKSGMKRFFRFSEGSESAKYYDMRGTSLPSSVISIPLHYSRLSSPFGMRFHPVLKRRQMHSGVDFSAPRGTPVWACQKGTVTFANRKGANGKMVVVKHAGSLSSYYCHLDRFATGMKNGVDVRERQVVGYVGSTGRSTGPHLHFALKKGGRFIDPLKYKIQPGRPVAAKYRKKLKTLISRYGRMLDTTPIVAPTAPLSADVADSEVLGLEEEM